MNDKPVRGGRHSDLSEGVYRSRSYSVHGVSLRRVTHTGSPSFICNSNDGAIKSTP